MASPTAIVILDLCASINRQAMRGCRPAPGKGPQATELDAPRKYASDRPSFVDRLANLGGAGRADRTLVRMEVKTAIVPRQAAMGDDPPRLAFQVGGDVLITHVEDAAGGQHPMPMRHQLLVAAMIAAELAKIIGVVLRGRKTTWRNRRRKYRLGRARYG